MVLDLQASTEEIKSREVELGLRVGLLLLQLFPNGGATDIVFVTSSRDSSCVVRELLRNAERTLSQHSVVLAAVYGSLVLPGWRLSRVFTLLPPPPRPRPPPCPRPSSLSPSLIATSPPWTLSKIIHSDRCPRPGARVRANQQAIQLRDTSKQV